MIVVVHVVEDQVDPTLRLVRSRPVLCGLTSSPAIERWMATRTRIAVDLPVSLARGQVRTESFKISLRNSYRVEIDTGEQRQASRSCYSYGLLKARWLLYRDGKLVANWYDPSPYSDLGWFDSEKGT